MLPSSVALWSMDVRGRWRALRASSSLAAALRRSSGSKASLVVRGRACLRSLAQTGVSGDGTKRCRGPVRYTGTSTLALWSGNRCCRSVSPEASAAEGRVRGRLAHPPPPPLRGESPQLQDPRMHSIRLPRRRCVVTGRRDAPRPSTRSRRCERPPVCSLFGSLARARVRARAAHGANSIAQRCLARRLVVCVVPSVAAGRSAAVLRPEPPQRGFARAPPSGHAERAPEASAPPSSVSL